MARTARPLGVTVVAVIAWLSGVWNIIQGVLALIAGAATWNVLVPWVLIFLGALVVVVSLGLFRGDRTARLVVAIVLGISLLMLIALVTTGGATLWSALPSMVLELLGIVLLFTPRANTFFRG